LLVGAPGAGKSTFCHQTVLRNIATDRPVILVTTEQSPSEVTKLLREKGLGESEELNLVDAFTQTVGLACAPREAMICANCSDLNSLSIAITKLRERTGQKNTLLVFDSLTSPYLFNGTEVVKFMRLFLSKFASEGNSVLVLVDEGCGKEEDMVAMMSIADGILRMEMKESLRIINVVKHPKVTPARIEVPTEPERIELKSVRHFDPIMMRRFMRSMVTQGKVVCRNEVGDFVNLFWSNLAHWSGMLWDPKRFPMMIYELNKEDGALALQMGYPFLPWHWKLFFKFIETCAALGLLPRNLSSVKNVKKAVKLAPMFRRPVEDRAGIVEYLEEVSKTDEHYFRVYENADCWGFEDIGATMASHLPAEIAGFFTAYENGAKVWNGIETKCIGLGDPYCEFKFVPGEIRELGDSLQKDSSVIERIHERLMHYLIEFLLDGKPLMERPKLGSEVFIHPVAHAFGFPYLAGERYRMALRMGGARSGKEVGKRLQEAGLTGDEAVRKIIDFMNYCKVGKVTMGDTIRIDENCESWATRIFTTADYEDPCCFFTTGFLNGFFLATRNQHIREIRCFAAGDPYCEWDII